MMRLRNMPSIAAAQMQAESERKEIRGGRAPPRYSIPHVEIMKLKTLHESLRMIPECVTSIDVYLQSHPLLCGFLLESYLGSLFSLS